MEIKDILLFLEAGEPSESAIELAASLAEQHGAVLTGLCSWPDPAVDPSDSFATGLRAVSDVLARREAGIARVVAPVETAFHAIAAKHNLEVQWTLASLNEPPQDLALRARTFDLAIVRRPLAHDHGGRRLAELVALTSGAPCLMLPDPLRPSSKFERILLAWNDSREARRALDGGLALLQRAKFVRLVDVDDKAFEPPSASDGQDILRHLRRHGVEAEYVNIHSPHEDTGSVLLDQCARFSADLMIMGSYQHSRAEEIILGGATRAVLAHAMLPVLMSH
jgi:nucleotide-binding universal stress UspA family protein